jgi:F420-dependent oxidoreductase-like protein
VKLGLHVPSFTWDNGPTAIASDLDRIAQRADTAGFDRLSVMDHVWQISHLGPPEQEMLEAYTTLGYLAARTERVKLLTLVTGVVYRAPGLLAKAVTTLDVLSHGRAMLGIGAAWNAEEAAGLGLFFPSTSERFERLEEALQVVLQMWSESDASFAGKHYVLTRTLNSPQILTRPHPPILIGGSGENKTLRLVAKYADACNLFGGPELERKLAVLQTRCDEVGRDYDEIEKTAIVPIDPGANGERVDQLLQQLADLHALGITVAHGSLPQVASLDRLDVLAERVIPAIASW